MLSPLTHANDVRDAWATAFREGDRDLYESLYAIDAVEVSPRHPRVRGRAEILEKFDEYCRSFPVRQIHFDDINRAVVELPGDYVLDTGTSVLHLEDFSGNTVDVKGEYSVLIDYRYHIILLHVSELPTVP